MMGNDKYLKDQLCHIFNCGVSSLCLICKITVCGKSRRCSRNASIINHLEGSVHQQNIRTLFQMCIPDPVCKKNNKKYFDIVTKSIFDISVSLGEETSYICRKGGQLVCLMCQFPITGITSSFAQIKDKLSQHLESSMHTNNIKEVCWYYRLNTEKDYLLLHKSIWHCSVCEVTFQCREKELLQSAVEHLESNSHKVRQHFTEMHAEKEIKAFEKSQNNFLKNLTILNENGTLDSTHSVDEEKVNPAVKVEPEMIQYSEKMNSVKLELDGELKPFNSVIKDKMKTFQGKLHVNKDIPIPANAKEQPVGDWSLNNNSEVIEDLLKDTSPFVLENKHFVRLVGKKVFCIVCQKIVCNDNNTQLENMLSDHFSGKKHVKKLINFRGKDTMEESKSCLHKVEPENLIMFHDSENLNSVKLEPVGELKPFNSVLQDEMNHFQETHLVKKEIPIPANTKMQPDGVWSSNNNRDVILKDTSPFVLENKNLVCFIDKKVFCIVCRKIVCNHNKTQLTHQLCSHFSGKKHAEQLLNVRGKRSMEESKSCPHKCMKQNRIFNKCVKCLRRILGKYSVREVSFLRVQNEKSLCIACGKTLSSTDIDSFISSCLVHFKSKTHKQKAKLLLKETLKSKQERKVKQKKQE